VDEWDGGPELSALEAADPVLRDAAPAAGSHRYTTILEAAMSQAEKTRTRTTDSALRAPAEVVRRVRTRSAARRLSWAVSLVGWRRPRPW
jgi:hypothetical protein